MNRREVLPLSFLFFSSTSSIASAFVDPSTSRRAPPRTRVDVGGLPSAASYVVPPWSSSSSSSSSMTSMSLLMTGEKGKDYYRDDDENPLSRGIDSVSWLPPLSGPRPPPSRSVFDPSADDDDGMEGGVTETLPLFPLGGIVYTPNSEHVLNIFEPRYRQMYNDILMNGSKRFVVAMCHPSEEGRFAKVGVLFSLEELKEVSGMTADRVKYICNHRVTGRVRLHEVLNPEAWESRDTYLKVRGTIIDDTGHLNREGKEEDEDDLDESIAKKLVSAGECFCPFAW
jgi:hypothetical protein